MIRSIPNTIVYLNRTSEISGAEMSLLSLLSNIDRHVFRPVVILPAEGPLLHKLRDIDIESRVLGLSFVRKSNPLPYCTSVVRLARELARLRPALVHSNVYMCSQYGVPAAALSGVDFLSHVRLILPALAIRNSFLSHAGLLIANSYAVSKALKDGRVSPAKVAVIHNGVDTERFSKDRTRRRRFREKMRISEDVFLIGCIGRFHPSKGQLELLEAIAMVQKEGVDVHCVFVGGTKIDDSGEYLCRLKERALSLGIDDKMRFLDFREDIRSVYDGMDLLALPSVQEPFGRVLIEAMSMSRPVLAVNTGGPREIVRDSLEGFLVRDNRPAVLRDGIVRAMQSSHVLQVMGERGRERVKRHFSVQQYVHKLETLYLRRIIGTSDVSTPCEESKSRTAVTQDVQSEEQVEGVGAVR